MARVVVCQHCHGSGRVTVWNAKTKTYETKTCPACNGRGRHNIGTI